MKQLIATTVLLTLIGCASAQDYNRFDSNNQKKPSSIHNFFFGLSDERAKRLEMDMIRKERARVSEIAIRQLSGTLAVIKDPNSLHFENITLLNDIFESSREVQAFFGGSFEAKPTGKKHKTGDEIYSIRIFNPLINEDIMTFNETAKGIIVRFDAYCSNKIKKAITQDGQTSRSKVKPDTHSLNNYFNTNQRNQQQGFGHSWDGENIYMQPYEHDAYGLGVHSDATGKPFEWKTQDGDTSWGEVEPDAYGLGVGMDEYGRPVKPSPWGQK